MPKLRLPKAEIVRPPDPAFHCWEARRTIALLKVWVWTSLFVSPASPSVSVLPLKVNPPLAAGVRLNASDVTASLPPSVMVCCELADASNRTEAHVVTCPLVSTSLGTAPLDQLPPVPQAPELVEIQRAVVGVTTESR